jgi:hypothetical protein
MRVRARAACVCGRVHDCVVSSTVDPSLAPPLPHDRSTIGAAGRSCVLQAPDPCQCIRDWRAVCSSPENNLECRLPKETTWKTQPSGSDRRQSCRVRLAASIFQPGCGKGGGVRTHSRRTTISVTSMQFHWTSQILRRGSRKMQIQMSMRRYMQRKSALGQSSNSNEGRDEFVGNAWYVPPMDPDLARPLPIVQHARCMRRGGWEGGGGAATQNTHSSPTKQPEKVIPA